MSTLYKTSGLVVEIDDDPANPNQPWQPGRIIPRGSAQDELALILNPNPVTQFGTDTLPPSPTNGNSPYGPGGNFILLSSLLGRGGRTRIPPGATIINDL